MSTHTALGAHSISIRTLLCQTATVNLPPGSSRWLRHSEDGQPKCWRAAEQHPTFFNVAGKSWAVPWEASSRFRAAGRVQCSAEAAGDSGTQGGLAAGSGAEAEAVTDAGSAAEARLLPDAVELLDAHTPAEALGDLLLSRDEVVERLAEILGGEEGGAAAAATALMARVDQQGRACLLSALFASAPGSSDEPFEQADANHDGVLDRTEFAAYVELQAVKYGHSSRPLTSRQVLLLGTRAAIGMLGFGFTDNFVMILAGDAIQSSIGLTWGLSPLMSAGLGNAVADVVGTAFREYIEGISSSLMPDSRVSPIQMAMKEAWWAETIGASVGVTAGCLLGLAPLLVLSGGQAEAPPGDSPSPQAPLASRISGSVEANPRVAGARAESPIGEAIMCSHEDPVREREGRGASTEGTTYFASIGMGMPPPKCSQQPGYSMYVGLIIVLSAGMGARRMWNFLKHR